MIRHNPARPSCCHDADRAPRSGSMADAESPVQVAIGRPRPSLKVHRPEVDHVRIERAVREILLAIGEDPDREGLADTPRRVAKAYSQIFAGLRHDPAEHLHRVFEERTDESVICRNIEFHSMCEHHLLPFFGRVHIAYLPNGREVVGLSKLARTVEVFARRPQVQERLTSQIADALVEHVRPRGVAVLVQSEHLCMKMRGVNKQNAEMVTTAFRGVYRDDPALRIEVLGVLQGGAR